MRHTPAWAQSCQTAVEPMDDGLQRNGLSRSRPACSNAPAANRGEPQTKRSFSIPKAAVRSPAFEVASAETPCTLNMEISTK